jgi:hypothetical protein
VSERKDVDLCDSRPAEISGSPVKRNFIAKQFSMTRHDPGAIEVRMKPKANLVLLTGLLAILPPLFSQSAETLPSVPRADGTGPSTPSMTSTGDARGSTQTKAATPIPQPKPAVDVPAATPNPAAPAASTSAPATGATATPAAPASATQKPVPRVRPPRPPLPDTQGSIPRRRTHGIDPAKIDKAEGIAEAYNTTDLGKQIRNTPFSAKQMLLDNLAKRMETLTADVDETRRTAPTLSGDARKRYNVAAKEYREKTRMFEQALGYARGANEEKWTEARNFLASTYETYSVAVTRLEGAGAFSK